MKPETGNLKPGAIAVGLVVLVLAGLTACGGKSDSGRTELLVFDVGTRPGDRMVWEKTKERFKALHPDVDVLVRLHKDDDYTRLHLPQALRSNRPPDLYFQWAGYAVHRDAGNGVARDISADLDDAWKAQFDPRAFRGTTHEGKHHMIPIGMDASNVLWYRRSILAKHGIDPPATWAAFVEACKKLKAAGVTPIIHGNQPGWPAGNWAAHVVEMIVGIDGYESIGDPKAAGRVRLDDPRVVRAAALFEDLARMGAFNPDIDTLDPEEGEGLFNRGAGAFHFNGGWIVENLAAPDDVGLLAQPVPPGEAADPRSVLATAAGLMVHARTPHPELAVELLRVLTSEAIQTESVALGRSTAVKAAMAKATKPHQRAIIDLLGASSNWVAAPDISWHPAIAEEFNRAVKAVVGGRATAQEALRAAAQNVAR